MRTQHKELRFGTIEDGLVQLNEAGAMVSSSWESNVSRYPGAALDVFVVMPDHIHAIVFLGTEPDQPESAATLSRVNQSFKSISTVEYTSGVRAGRFPTYNKVLWQRGFHDKILRSDRALEAARAYGEANPGKWAEQRD